MISAAARQCTELNLFFSFAPVPGAKNRTLTRETFELMVLIPNAKMKQQKPGTQPGQDQTQLNTSLTEETQGRSNNMDQAIKGECLRNRWIDIKIVKKVENGKNK
jgi:hypothetical protein